MLERQLKIALIPAVLTIAFASLAIVYRGSTSGSATSGYVADGRFFLSLGHGHYQETDPAQFIRIRTNERIASACIIGMVASLGVAALLVRRAGLPVHAADIPPAEQWLRPR